MIHWTTTKAASAIAGVKALVYGPSGVGKTKLAATAPQPLIVSIEAGTLSLAKADTPEIPMAVVHTPIELQEVYAWLLTPAASVISTVYIDSVSELTEVLVANLKAQYKDPRQAYGDAQDQTLAIIRSFRDLPRFNVIFSAKMEYAADGATGAFKYQPSMPGKKLGPQLPYLFDEVFRMGIGKTMEGASYRFLQTQPDLQYDAKDRSGSLESMEPPDLGAIFRKINGGL